MSTPNAGDSLKYLCAIVRQRIACATDAIASDGCDGDHDDALAEIRAIIREVDRLAAPFGDPHVYSDGRQVETTVQIEPYSHLTHTWHPDPTAEKARSYGGSLLYDPDTECPGFFQVATDPATQTIDIAVIRP
jgi:hypothetical protein